MRTVQAEGESPSVLRAVDPSPPGYGHDTEALWVGDAVADNPEVALTPGT